MIITMLGWLVGTGGGGGGIAVSSRGTAVVARGCEALVCQDQKFPLSKAEFGLTQLLLVPLKYCWAHSVTLTES
jgi:hypothetical protein